MRTEGGSTGTAELQTCGVFIVLFLGSATPCLFGMMVLSSKERMICFTNALLGWALSYPENVWLE